MRMLKGREIQQNEAKRLAKEAQDVAAAIRVIEKQARELACEAENAGWNFSMDFAAGANKLLEAREYFATWNEIHATDCGVKSA